ncbi:MAG: PilN domain-containing protein [Deltaproteobacteria bacterium]|nr:PilN domain-containing protein [Deltaproteobacteria bacterium]
MIKRINLVEKKAFSFTYMRLAQACLVVLLFNVSYVAVKYYSVSSLEKKLKSEQVSLSRLEAERDSLMKKPEKKKISVGQYETLLEKIEGTPKWAGLLNEVSRHLPNTVWITQFKSLSSETPVAAAEVKDKKGAKNKQKAKPVVTSGPAKYSLELSGLGTDMRNITEFTTKLSASDYFVDLVLKKSDKENYGFSFTINSEIKTGMR